MRYKDEGWGWMLAADFFLAGMGGGMLIIAGLVDLFIGGGRMSLLGNVIAPLAIALGPVLLVLELGRPFQALRVFMNPKSILTIGSWSMSIAIMAAFVFASFGIDLLPWSGMVALRKVFAIICVVFGVIVATYPGVLLGRLKSRPFWNGPGMVTMFFLSSLVTGAAAHCISGIIWNAPNMDTLNSFPLFIASLLGVQLIMWFSYIWVKRSGTEMEAATAKMWTDGEYSMAFKVGIIFVGIILPLVFETVSGTTAHVFGALFVLLGNLIMRLTVVYSGNERTWIPGETQYKSRLPHGSEAFLKVQPFLKASIK